MSKPRLPRHLRDELERFLVLEPPGVPKLDFLEEKIRARGGVLQLEVGETMSSARVHLKGAVYDGASDSAGIAVCEAFVQALRATQPVQGGLFDEPHEENEEDELDLDADVVARDGSLAEVAFNARR